MKQTIQPQQISQVKGSRIHLHGHKSTLQKNWAIVSCVWLVLAFNCISAEDLHPSAIKKIVTKQTTNLDGNELFGLSKLHTINLELSAVEWKSLQVDMPSPFSRFFQSSNKSAEADTKQRDVHQGNNIAFPWAQCNMTCLGKSHTNVGLRYKGNFTFMATQNKLKRSFKVELDHYNKEAPPLDGIRKFNLHAGVLDNTKVREALSYAVFRAAGVAAPRTAFAEVILNIPGKYEREYVGCYTLTEQVDKQFLNNHFQNNNGLLMKPLVRGPEYFGETWSKVYIDRYGPSREPTVDESQKLIHFARLVNHGSPQQFNGEIESILDVEAFLKFLAVSALLVNLDSPLAMPQNYYLYLNPKSGKFIFFPWDLDLGMAAWPFGGSQEQQLNLSILHPHAGDHPLIDRLLAMPEMKERYLRIIRDAVKTWFSKESLHNDISLIEQTVKGSLAKEVKAVGARKEATSFGVMGLGMRAPDPRTFAEKRPALVMEQLAGKSSGYVPKSGMFPMGN